MHGMSPHDEIEYWRERAEKAEQRLSAMADERNAEILGRARLATAMRDHSDDRSALRAEIQRLRNAVCALIDRRAECYVCHDTHLMSRAGRVGQCWHCPKPCDECRGDYGSGPYCRETPCGCGCHGGGR